MRGYRLYGLDGRGQIAGAPELIEATSDDDARQQAAALGRPFGGELWQGGRLVARITPAKKT